MSTQNRKPEEKTILFAAKMSLEEDKPIYFSYWNDSLNGGVCIFCTDKALNERVIYKNKDEFTSPIKKKFTNNNDAILLTENSIYIVSNSIKIAN